MQFQIKKILLSLSLFFLFHILHAQDITQKNRTDSLRNKIKDVPAVQKVSILNEISKMFWYVSTDSSLHYANKALAIAQQINDDGGISDALNRIGNAYYFMEEDEKALSYYKNSLEIREKLNDYKRLIQIYNNLGVYYSFLNKTDKALEYYQKAFSVSKKNNDKRETAKYYTILASFSRDKSNYDKAIEYYINAEEIYKELKQPKSLGNIYNAKALIYQDISSYDKALKAFLKALDYYKEAGDKVGMANSYNGIGIINKELKNYDKALEYFNKMSDIFKELDVSDELSMVYNNIGIIYDEKEENQKALEYYEKAYEIDEKFEDKKGMAVALNNIGLIYYELEKYSRAIDYLQQSLNISKELNNKISMANTYNNMGEVLIMQKKYLEAQNKIDTGLILSREVKARGYIDESYRLYSVLYEAQQQYEKALHYHKLHSQLNDSIYSRERQNRIAEIQIKYETEKKEKEITLLKQAHELKYKRQRTIIVFIIILAGMLAILAALVYNQFRLKKKNAQILQGKNAQMELANKKLKESEKNLTELNATKDKFFSIISHDLKNPFQALFGFAEVMYHNIDEFARNEIKDYSKAIYESSQNLYNLLENLLQWSRSQLGSIQLKPEIINIRSAVDEIIGLLNINAEEKNISMINNISPNETAFVDENVFSTVMRNLLNNSIKFTGKGGKIEINAHAENDEVLVAVHDTGKGITKKDIQKLFRIDKSHSTKGTANEPGTGLGLILCKELIEKSNGNIWVESEEGKGSTFKFSLPAKA